MTFQANILEERDDRGKGVMVGIDGMGETGEHERAIGRIPEEVPKMGEGWGIKESRKENRIK